MNTRPLEERFWERVKKTPGCWLWTVRSKRYGQIFHNGTMRAAHRVSWELHNGPIPEGQNVLHECDNTLCIRPDHLFLGTQKDNMRDCASKRRHYHGDRHQWSKLTAAQVIESRAAHKAGARVYLLARRFGVDWSTMWQAITGQTWNTIPL